MKHLFLHHLSCILVFAFVLTMGVSSCASHRSNAGRGLVEWSEKMKTLAGGEQERRFASVYLESVSRGLVEDYDAQYELLCEAERIMPNQPEVAYDMAQLARKHPILVMDSLLPEPLQLIERAVSQAPQNKDFRKDLILEYIKNGNLTEAIAQCDTLLANKYSESIAYTLYQLHYACGNYPQAYETIDNIAHHGGDKWECEEERFKLLQQTKDSTFALAKAEEYMMQNPGERGATLGYIGVLTNFGQYEKAQEICDKWLAQHAEDPDFMTEEIRIVLASGDTSSVAQEKISKYLVHPECHSQIKAFVCILWPATTTKTNREKVHRAEQLMTMALSTKQEGTDLLHLVVSRLKQEVQAVHNLSCLAEPTLGDGEGKVPAHITFRGDTLVCNNVIVDYENAEQLADSIGKANEGEGKKIVYNQDVINDIKTRIAADRKRRGVHPWINTDSIISIYEHILQISPDEDKTRFTLLSHYINEENIPRLKTLCEDAMLYNKDILIYGYYGGMVYLQEGDFDKALDMFKKAVEGANEDAEPQIIAQIYTYIGDIEKQRGDIDAAIKAYETGISYYPYDATLANNFAYTLSEIGQDLDRAEEYVLVALDSEPKLAYIWDTYAWILYKKGEYARAIDAIERSISLITEEDNSATYHKHAGDIYLKHGNRRKAVSYWKKALNATTDKETKKEIQQRLRTMQVPE